MWIGASELFFEYKEVAKSGMKTTSDWVAWMKEARAANGEDDAEGELLENGMTEDEDKLVREIFGKDNLLLYEGVTRRSGPEIVSDEPIFDGDLDGGGGEDEDEYEDMESVDLLASLNEWLCL